MIPIVELVSPSGSALHALLELSIRATIVLVAAWAATACLRRAPAALRHALWCAALGAVLALPALSFALPAWHLSLPSSLAPAAPALPQRAGPPVPGPEAAVYIPAEPAPDEQGGAPPSVRWPALAAGIWCAGALAVAAWLLAGWVSMGLIASRAAPVDDREWLECAERLARRLSLASGVRLRTSPRVAVPVTYGAVAPVVLLPVDSASWSRERRAAVLLHELAHVKRRDCLTQLLAQIACSLYWFNPLVWVAARQLRIER